MDQNEKIKRDKKGLLVLFLLLVAVISGTFAVTFSRYYSSTNGKAEAKVAKWSLLIEDQKMEDTASIDLAECEWDNTSSTADDGKLAPGSVCDLYIVVTNQSEVEADLDATIGDIVDKGTQQKISNSAIQATVVTEDSATHLNSAKNATTSAPNRGGLHVRVTWDPGSDDTVAGNTTDTTMGINAADLEFNVTVTAKQTIN